MFWSLKPLVVIVLGICCASARATSLQSFEAKSPEEQGRLVSDFVLKVKTDIAAKDPQLAEAIWEYFTHDAPGKPVPQGVEDLMVQVMTVDALAKQGKADPMKIQVEGMIVYVLKQRFKKSTDASR